jgi:acetyl esterase
MPDDAELDPQAATMLEAIEAIGLPPSYATSPATARQRLEDFFSGGDPEPVGATTDYEIPGPAGGIPVRQYSPGGAGPHPLVVFYHGGGWTAGSLDTHDNVCRALVNRADCVVLSVDYRLAPEHPFPAAFEDCYAAATWAAAYADTVDCDPERIAVAGDSAGGNLAAAVSLRARDERRGIGFRDEPGDAPDIVHQALIYPAVNSPAGPTFGSYEENAEGYFLERASIEYYYGNYVADPVDARNAYLAPLLADDLSALPPASVLTAGFDPLRDEGRAYVERLREAGVEVTHEEFAGQIHAFVSMADELDAAADGLDFVGEELAAAFGTD